MGEHWTPLARVSSKCEIPSVVRYVLEIRFRPMYTMSGLTLRTERLLIRFLCDPCDPVPALARVAVLGYCRASV